MAKASGKHHYLPVFYLAGFTSSGSRRDRFWVLDREKAELRRSRPSSEGYQCGFYRVDIADVAPTAVEDDLSRIESIAAPVIQKIISTHELPTGDDLVTLAAFIGLMEVRVPVARENTARPDQEMSRRMLQMMVSSRERYDAMTSVLKGEPEGSGMPDISFEQMREFVERDDYRIQVDQTHLIELMFV